MLNANINFTASTGVVLDMTHDNSMMAFNTFLNATSFDECYEVIIDFYLLNESFYRASLTSDCAMNVSLWGFSRYIFDKTDIESFGVCFFEYGSIEAFDGEDAPLTVTLQRFSSNNFMYGMNSYSIMATVPILFTSVIGATTTSVSNTNFKMLRFMYWAFNYRTCEIDYPYFNLDEMLCFDTCGVRYYPNETSMTC